MLDPNQRSQYTAGLKPPLGYVFDQGLATTYSLDLTTLLTVPLHLVLFSSEGKGIETGDSVALLEALRRTTKKIGIYCQQGQIKVPRGQSVLFSMLEPIIVEVSALHDAGIFHPKIWLLRYIDPKQHKPPLLKLIILSRNLTQDRSWDLSLHLEGTPGRQNIGANRQLGELVAKLPDLSCNGVTQPLRTQAETLADELRRTKWKLPPGYEEVRFHALGIYRKQWQMPESRALAVISPFCTNGALKKLVETTDAPKLLLSREEELEKLDSSIVGLFDRCVVLDESVDAENGEDPGDGTALRGLHAKAYILKKGWNTHIVIGSANATNAALVGNRNIEILAELVGKSSKVGEIEDLLSDDGLGEVLRNYLAPVEPPETNDDLLETEKDFRQAVAALGKSGLRLTCTVGTDETYRLKLSPNAPVSLGGIDDIRCWPVTLPRARSVDALPLGVGKAIDFSPCALADVTGLLAFELSATKGAEKFRFVLNIPLDGVPPNRDAAIIQAILSTTDNFLRFLLLLLEEVGDDGLPSGAFKRIFASGKDVHKSLTHYPLLEEMTRAFSREPAKLERIRSLVEELSKTEKGKVVIPEEFASLWEVFASCLPKSKV